MSDDFTDILSIAVHAPSNNNAQPWQFKFDNHSLCVFNVPSRDKSPANYKQRLSYVGHGALIENICMVAAEKGFGTYVELFPGDENCVAKITFTPATMDPDPLYRAIMDGSSNRKPYYRKSLTIDDRALLEISTNKLGIADVRVMEGEEVRLIGKLASLNEKLTFENRELHDAFFGLVRWTEEEEKQKPGLYIKTLEYPFLVRFLFKNVFRHYIVVRILDLFGLSSLISWMSSWTYCASSAMAAIIVKGTSDKDFIAGGRALQRFWLTATKIGLSVQPIPAVPYLAQRVKGMEAGTLNAKQKEMIEQANKHIAEAFELQKEENMIMLLRVGYCSPPSARSFVLPPDILA